MNISGFSKAIASGAMGVVAWGTAAATLLALIPNKQVAGVVAGLLLVVHFVQTFLVWLTKNEPIIDADFAAVQKIASMVSDWSGTLDELKSVVHQVISAVTGKPVTPAAPVSDGE